jgi:hypothetical protein
VRSYSENPAVDATLTLAPDLSTRHSLLLIARQPAEAEG